MSSSDDKVLEVRGLTTEFVLSASRFTAVNDVSLEVRRGETLAIVGESGSGKSMLAFSIMGLVDRPGRISAGEILLSGRNLAQLDDEEMRHVRGRDLSIIFQEPSTSLNPLMNVGRQVAEAILEHERDVTSAQATSRVVDLFRLVGIPAPELRVRDYPHQLSGGMRQRVMIAMALACRPALLLADEPTTALDVTVQAQVLALIDDLQAKFGMGVILITHDLGVVADHADRVMVMYAGSKVEEGTIVEILDRPAHPYTRALLACRPDISRALDGAELIEIPGVVPSLDRLPPGCAFADRCRYVQGVCRSEKPPFTEVGGGHSAACHFAASIMMEPL
jgi:oligopeptide/dipeptide ABC transporter ATP-binding protein